MVFTDIIDIHNSYSREACYDDILGDGFLLETNPVYRKIRSFSLEIGCRYVEAYPDYLLLPFHELPTIVEQKRIPYVPSARLIKKVELSQPEVFSTEDMAIPESYHLHEAAHVVAEHFLKNLKPNNSQEQILKSMFAESFANTIDALICIQAVDEINYFFIKQNCYMQPQKKIIKAMDNISKKLGFRFLFTLTFFTYLHANFLSDPPSKTFVQDLLQKDAPAAKLNAKLEKDITTVCEIGEMLDQVFRVTTTGNYLKQLGFKEDLYELLNFSFMATFNNQPVFAKALQSLYETIED